MALWVSLSLEAGKFLIDINKNSWYTYAVVTSSRKTMLSRLFSPSACRSAWKLLARAMISMVSTGLAQDPVPNDCRSVCTQCSPAVWDDQWSLPNVGFWVQLVDRLVCNMASFSVQYNFEDNYEATIGYHTITAHSASAWHVQGFPKIVAPH